jgi:hypothetical protein
MMKHLHNLLGFARTTQFPIGRATFQGNVRHDSMVISHDISICFANVTLKYNTQDCSTHVNQAIFHSDKQAQFKRNNTWLIRNTWIK